MLNPEGRDTERYTLHTVRVHPVMQRWAPRKLELGSRTTPPKSYLIPTPPPFSEPAGPTESNEIRFAGYQTTRHLALEPQIDFPEVALTGKCLA